MTLSFCLILLDLPITLYLRLLLKELLHILDETENF